MYFNSADDFSDDESLDIDVDEEEEEEETFETDPTPQETKEEQKPDVKESPEGRLSARKMYNERRKPGQPVFQHQSTRKKKAAKKKKNTKSTPQEVVQQDDDFEINVQHCSCSFRSSRLSFLAARVSFFCVCWFVLLFVFCPFSSGVRVSAIDSLSPGKQTSRAFTHTQPDSTPPNKINALPIEYTNTHKHAHSHTLTHTNTHTHTLCVCSICARPKK